MSDQDPFDEHLLRVVDSFLQTVVVVDDQVTLEPPAVKETETEGIATPGRGRGVQSGLIVPPDHTSREHDLDAKRVTDAFAKNGLICALLAPSEGEEISAGFVKTAQGADLVVLDWVMHRDDGKATLKLIADILEADTQPYQERLRTIAIYTGQQDLRDVARRVREVLDRSYTGSTLEEHDGGLAMSKGPVRVAVFAKEYVSELPPDLESRRVAFDGLPDRLREEFASLTSGIVTAVALAALAALRKDTHRVLKILGPSLDPAYLGHRSVLSEPVDAEGQALALVASELRAVIEDRKIGELANEAVLSLWLDRSAGEGRKFGELIDPTKVIPRAQVDAMLSVGLGSKEGMAAVSELGKASKGYLGIVKLSATHVFATTSDVARAADIELANLMMLRTTYSSPPRTLQLGTVIQAPRHEFWVCVQPVCDSVRLPQEVRTFPFLRVSVSDRDRFEFVVKDMAGSDVFLRLTTNPRDLVTARFKPGQGERVITAVFTGREYKFRDTSNVLYRWVAQLKPEFAQKVAVDLANELAQVAVDPAEIRRLSLRQ